MISIPASYLLVGFSSISFIFILFVFAHLYHGYRYGRHDPLTMTVNSAFVLVTASIIILTVMLLLPVDWSGAFTVSTPSSIPTLDIPNDVNQVQSILPGN